MASEHFAPSAPARLPAQHQHPVFRPDMFDRRAAEFGRGPTAYFWEFGRQLAALAAVRPGDRALDVAAGTGAVAVPVAQVGARVLALDLSAPMLAQLSAGNRDRAGGRAPLPIFPVRASAQALPCPAAAVDVLTCGFGIAFFPDLPAALAEFRRALRPEGRLALCWWLYETHTPWVEAAWMGAERSEQARQSWERSRSLAAPEQVRALVRDAGFPDARTARLRVEWNAGPLDAVWERWLRDWQTPENPLPPEEVAGLRARLAGVAARYTLPDGTLRYPLEAFAVVSGA